MFLVSLRGRLCCKRPCRLFLVFCGQKRRRCRRAKPPHVLHGVTTAGTGDRRGPLPVAPRRAALVPRRGRGDNRVTNQPGRVGGSADCDGGSMACAGNRAVAVRIGGLGALGTDATGRTRGGKGARTPVTLPISLPPRPPRTRRRSGAALREMPDRKSSTS